MVVFIAEKTPENAESAIAGAILDARENRSKDHLPLTCTCSLSLLLGEYDRYFENIAFASLKSSK